MLVKMVRITSHSHHVGPGRGRLWFGALPGGTWDRCAVVTVTAAATGFIPSGVTEVGETEQVEREGAPLQFRATFALKPKDGVTVKV